MTRLVQLWEAKLKQFFNFDCMAQLAGSQLPNQELNPSHGSGWVPEKHLHYWLCQSLCVDHNKLWEILKEMGIPDHLTCLLRNLYAGQEATVRIEQGTMDWFQIGKGVHQSCILSPCLFNLYAKYIMWNAGLDESQAGSKLPGEISITSDMQMTLPLRQKVTRNWRALDETERGEWKSWLKT